MTIHDDSDYGNDYDDYDDNKDSDDNDDKNDNNYNDVMSCYECMLIEIMMLLNDGDFDRLQ